MKWDIRGDDCSGAKRVSGDVGSDVQGPASSHNISSSSWSAELDDDDGDGDGAPFSNTSLTTVPQR